MLELKVFPDGAGPVISAVCRSIGLTQTIDRILRWDDRQCKLSPGLRIEALIINVLMNHQPLYRLDQFFSQMDVSKIFGSGITAADLNDDAAGRALERLAESDPREVYGTIALKAACHEGVNLDVLHADTTSVSVQGMYEDHEIDDLLLTFGYSKDMRPDLKQFMYGLAVTQEQIPVLADVMDGNTSDNTWNHQMIKRLRNWLGESRSITYVADSSFVSLPNLQAAAKHRIKFISRLPATFSLEAELKNRAWRDLAWKDVGVLSKRKDAASYEIQSYQADIEGEAYRFVVVHSSKLDVRKQKSIENQLSKTEAEISKALKALSKRQFACEPDAHEAWRDFIKQNHNDCFQFEYEVMSLQRPKRRASRGRPSKDAAPEFEVFFQVNGTATRDEGAIQVLKSRASCFVLITNIPAGERLDEDILTEYKNQTAVEQHFAFIKNPKVVGPVFLKKPERIKALAYVFLMALLVYSIIQRRVRLALKQSGETLEVYDKRTSSEPTGRSVLQHLERVTVVAVNGIRQLPTNLALVRKVLKLLGLTEEVYLTRIPL